MYKGYQDLSGKHWYDIKYNANRRNIPFCSNLTIEYAWELFLKQNKKCALSGLDIELYPDIKRRNTASLDRIDNTLGYSRDNIQWLHKSVNNLKYKMSNKDTIELCRKIANYKMKKTNLIGEKFDDLTVIKPGNGKMIGKKNPKKRPTWICQCKCGKEVEILATNLRHKSRGTKSCGCRVLHSKKYNFTDLTNKTFGFLKVIKLLEEKTKTRGCYWLCECKCGNFVKLASNCLTSGNYVTCGDKEKHYKNNIDPLYKYYKEIPLAHLKTIKQNAIKREQDFLVEVEYLWDLYLSQNKKCALSGLDIYFTKKRDAYKYRYETTASLDRINNNFGYIVGNVRWTHKDINKMRSNHDDEKFIFYCNSCVNNHYFNNRPGWNEYFLNLAFNVSHRSEDPNIKHGAIIVNENNHICGTGYNALIKGATSNLVDIYNRDEKRKYMIHAEENAILNCFNRKNNMKMYITGEPCNNCLQRIINFNISEIIIANRIGSITENNETKLMKDKIVKESGIKITKIDLKTLLLDY